MVVSSAPRPLPSQRARRNVHTVTGVLRGGWSSYPERPVATKKKSPPNEVVAVYKERPDKRTIAVSGAWGGPSPDGASVAVHLFTDWGTIPSMIRFVPEGGGLKEKEILRTSEITREIQVSLMMPPQVAQSVGKLMIEKAKIVLDAQEAAKKANGRSKRS